MGTEREIKIALGSRADHDKLARGLPNFLHEAVQENSYWDSSERVLTEAGVMLRLRVVGTEAWVTIKRRATRDADGFFEASEDEVLVDSATARQVTDGALPLQALSHPLVDDLLAEYAIAHVERWGGMRNRRRSYQLADGWIAELDETHYPDGSVDWEVELEGDDARAGRQQIQLFLDQYAVSHRAQTATKSQRLRDRLGAPACAAFGGHSDDYERYRPLYPTALWDAIVALETGAALGEKRIVDLGAGTGKGSLELARRGFDVTAVEPDPRMRAAGAEAAQAAGADVWWQAGSAEATGLPDQSHDLAVAAQAFHWFDPANTFAEMRRILRPGGGVALWWNERQVAGCAWLEAFEQLVQKHNPAYRPDYRSRDWEAILREGGLADVQVQEFDHEQESSEQHFLGFVRSISYIRGALDDPAFARFCSDLKALLAEHHGASAFAIPYRAVLYTGRL